MAEIDRRQEQREFSEETSSLFRITLGPTVWALHFLISYVSAAVFCAKWGEQGESILGFRIGVIALTVLALCLIAGLGWRSWRQWDYFADRDYENKYGEDEDRHQFLGHAAFLLTIISFVGVIYTVLPVLFIATCR